MTNCIECNLPLESHTMTQLTQCAELHKTKERIKLGDIKKESKRQEFISILRSKR